MDVSSGKRLFLVALVASLTGTALLAIGILLFAEFDDTTGRILATTALIGLFSLLSLPAAVLLDRRQARILGYTTIVAAGIGLVFTLVLLWGEVSSEAPGKAALTLGLLAGALAQAAATTSGRRATDSSTVRWLYIGAMVAGGGLAAMGAGAAWSDVGDDTYYRFLGALAVADLLLVLLQPAVRRMGRSVDRTTFELVLTLDRAPCENAVAAAVAALEEAGVRVENVDRGS